MLIKGEYENVLNNICKIKNIEKQETCVDYYKEMLGAEKKPNQLLNTAGIFVNYFGIFMTRNIKC